MSHDYDKIVSEIKENGWTCVPDYFTAETCDFYASELNRILKERTDKGWYVGTNGTQVLENFFLECENPWPLLYNELVDSVMRRLIDQDYVVSTSGGRNQRIFDEETFGRLSSGQTWHTDTRYWGETRVTPSLGYFAIAVLEDFTSENGATRFVPGSHRNLERPERQGEYEYQEFLAKKGSVLFMDTAIWHIAGDPSPLSRWGVFTMFTPWFFKPYFNFPTFFTKEQAENLPPMIRQLLHFDSVPQEQLKVGPYPTLRRIKEEYQKNNLL